MNSYQYKRIKKNSSHIIIYFFFIFISLSFLRIELDVSDGVLKYDIFHHHTQQYIYVSS
jgi:hypothetical protein